MIREPAVSGQFYPADPRVLRREVERYLEREVSSPAAEPALALVVPHAGYIYSGRAAGVTYAAVDLPRLLIILCPNHTGEGAPVAVMPAGEWRTPLGSAAIDEPLARRLLKLCDPAEPDDRAHRREHALEVQLPFLQVKLPGFRFVPICVGTDRLSVLRELADGLFRSMEGWPEPVGIVVSTDMSHYIPAEAAREKDTMAIQKMVALDPEGLHQVVREEKISMCGFAPAVAGLMAARMAGARRGRLLVYTNSGETSGDYASVVGYAGLAIS